MTEGTLRLIGQGQAELVGTLDFATVCSLLLQGKALLQKEAALSIDLKGVMGSSSAGLALLTAWTRYAKQLQKKITFIHIPMQLRTIAEVCGVETILSL